MTTKEYTREVMVIDPKWLVEMAPRFFKMADSTKLSKRKQQERIEPLYDRHHELNSWHLNMPQKDFQDPPSLDQTSLATYASRYFIMGKTNSREKWNLLSSSNGVNDINCIMIGSLTRRLGFLPTNADSVRRTQQHRRSSFAWVRSSSPEFFVLLRLGSSFVTNGDFGQTSFFITQKSFAWVLRSSFVTDGAWVLRSSSHKKLRSSWVFGA
nr:putative pre-mrna-splicing factor atp-dependent rna helicase deah5 [Quercus suber]